MGIASLVLSIFAIMFCLIPIVGFIFALSALVVAIIAINEKKNKEEYKGLKVAGLVMSIIAMVISTLLTGPLVIGAYIISENSQEVIDKAEQAVLESEETTLRSMVTLEYVAQYYEYDEGERNTPPNARSILSNMEIREKLNELNQNKFGITYEIVDSDKGVILQKRNEYGQIIKEKTYSDI